MQAGTLKDKISLMKPTVTKTDTGSETVDFTHDKTVRAYVKYDGGNKINENGDVFFSNLTTFQIRWFPRFNELYQIKFNGRNYRILSMNEDRPTQSIIIHTEMINDFEIEKEYGTK